MPTDVVVFFFREGKRVCRDGSLRTRPFTGRRKGLGTHLHSSCPQVRMLPDQSELLIANAVMEMVFVQAFSVTNYWIWQIAVLFRVSPK